MADDRRDPVGERLFSSPGGQGQSRLPRAATDLFSQFQRRFSQSLFLPPMVPRFSSAASGSSSPFGYYQGAPALAPAAGDGGSHLLSTDQLAPLPYSGPSAGVGAAVTRFPLSLGAVQDLPPSGAGHRRSRSDFHFSFSNPSMSLAMPPTADAAALDGVFGPNRVMGALGSIVEGAEERSDHARGRHSWSPGGSSQNVTENWAEAGVRGGPSNLRHCRSLSVDSFMGNLNFGAMGQESPKLPPPSLAAGTSAGLSRTGSGPSGGPSALFSSELASGEFTEDERKKIMASDHLAEMALTDPKRVKRILANRMSAAKSKERKVKYTADLERRVRVMQMETSTLSAKVERELRESDALKTLNNEMRIRVQALEQQAQLKSALSEAMSAEVRRLKHAIGEASDPRAPNSSQQHMGCQMTPQQLLQLQNQTSEAQPEQAPQQEAQE